MSLYGHARHDRYLRTAANWYADELSRPGGVRQLPKEEQQAILAKREAEQERSYQEACALVRKYQNSRKLSERQANILALLEMEIEARQWLDTETQRLASWRRDRRKCEATPRWADLAGIDAIYERCRAMNMEAGKVAYHVDHIAPLQGKKVSGLHVHGNLRIIPKRDNLKKHNNFDDSMLND